MLVLIKKPKYTASSPRRNKDYDATVGMIGEVVDSYKEPISYDNKPSRYTVKFKGLNNSKSKKGYFYFAPREVIELVDGAKLPDLLIKPKTVIKEVEKPSTTVYVCLCTNTSYYHLDKKELWFYSNKPVDVGSKVTCNDRFNNMVVKCCFPYHYEDLAVLAKSLHITPLMQLECTYKTVTTTVTVSLL